MYKSNEGELVATEQTLFESLVDFDDNKVTNAIVSDGSIVHNSDIAINLNDTFLNSLFFFSIKRKNQIEQRPLALFGVKGMLENSNTFISTQGFVNSMKVSGSVNLRMEGFQDQSTNDNSEF